MGEIVFKNICKSFGETKVIENLDLTIKDGEFTVLVGASGCGKTTLLRMIAGIGPHTSGELFIDGEEVSDVPPRKARYCYGVPELCYLPHYDRLRQH